MKGMRHLPHTSQSGCCGQFLPTGRGNNRSDSAIHIINILRIVSVKELLFLQQQICSTNVENNQMKHSIVDLLIRPGAFFQKAINEKEKMVFPALIVLAGGTAGAMYGYLIGGLTGQLLGGIMPGMGTIITLLTILGALIGIFIFWVIWAGVLYAFSFVFKGEGTFKRMLEFTGYGYLPQVFGTLITFVIALDYIPRVHVPQLSAAAAQDPQLMQEAFKALMHDPAMMELSQIAMIISIVFLLWSANIWIFGMQHARKLSPRDAALCVGIPVVLYILYLVYSMTVM